MFVHWGLKTESALGHLGFPSLKPGNTQSLQEIYRFWQKSNRQNCDTDMCFCSDHPNLIRKHFYISRLYKKKKMDHFESCWWTWSSGFPQTRGLHAAWAHVVVVGVVHPKIIYSSSCHSKTETLSVVEHNIIYFEKYVSDLFCFPYNGLVTNILQNVLSCMPQKTENHPGLDEKMMTEYKLELSL